jgi:hypothetical protein
MLVASLMLFPHTAFADSVTYYFIMNTSSLSGSSGYIDMQFSEALLGGGGGMTAYNTYATATVSNFQTDGSLDAASLLTMGDVTGALNQPVTFLANGDGAFNDYYQGITFGNQLSFALTLAGQGVTTPICPINQSGAECNAPSFILDFLDSSQSTFLFTNDPSGLTYSGWIVGGVDVNLDATTTPYTNPGPGNAPSDLSINSNSVPEPSAWLLLGSGFIGVFLIARRVRRLGACY